MTEDTKKSVEAKASINGKMVPGKISYQLGLNGEFVSDCAKHCMPLSRRDVTDLLSGAEVSLIFGIKLTL